MNTSTPVSLPSATNARGAMQCDIVVTGLKVMADIGAYAAEKGVLQPLSITATLSVIPPNDDELGEAFDYAQICEFATTLATQRINLIETFARRLAEMCLRHDLVLGAVIEIDKPQALPGCVAGTVFRLSKQLLRQ
ncbi:dihydroneopterin aldolase [Sphingobium sp. LMA1-1-1.1]|uniref:dihydroneopterin aldolase n=1 Tax=unclassified Sphingobium TaxID=2611147 RepID=UPI0034374B1B